MKQDHRMIRHHIIIKRNYSYDVRITVRKNPKQESFVRTNLEVANLRLKPIKEINKEDGVRNVCW